MSAVLVPILAQVITLFAGDRTEVRTRLAPDDVYFDVETLPTAELELRTARTTWNLAYYPSLAFLAVGDPDFNQVVLLHSAQASAGFRWKRSYLRLAQSGSYGERNFEVAALSATAGPGTAATPPPETADPNAPTQPPVTAPAPTTPTGVPQPLITRPQTIRYISSRSEVAFSHFVSRRFSFDALAGYEIMGGLDETARILYPLQRGPLARLSLTWRATPIDRFATEFAGQLIDSQGGALLDPDLGAVVNENGIVIADDRRAALVTAGERWMHDFSRNVSGNIAAGVGYTYFKTEDDDPEQRLHPVASAGLRHTLYKADFMLEGEYNVQLMPIIDRNTGAVDDRFQWIAQLTWTREQLSFVLNLLGVESLSQDSNLALTSYNASFTMGYAFTPEWSMDTGVRTFWQRSGATDSVLGGVLFAGVTYTLPPTRL